VLGPLGREEGQVAWQSVGGVQVPDTGENVMENEDHRRSTVFDE
jgi:hypothetical protein